MTKIELIYKLLGIIPLKYKRQMPRRWEDLTPTQLIIISQIYERQIPDWRVVSKMLNIPGYVARRLDPFHLFCIIDELAFISEYKPCSLFVINKIKNLSSPGPRLQGMTWGQFISVDSYFNEYLDTNKPEFLHKFLASLYTPAPFQQHMITQNMGVVSKLSHDTHRAIIINYRLVLEWLISKYPKVFRKNEKKDPDRKITSPDWVRIHDSIVGDDIVNSDRYAERPVHDIFRFLTSKLKQHDKRR